jgi:PAS domain S-box-containing protein
MNGQPDALISESISDAILAGVVTISADAIVCVDEQQRIIFFNEGAAEIFGYEPSERVSGALLRPV